MSSLLIDQPGESAFHDPSLTIAQHASPYLPFEPVPFIPDEEPLDDEYHGPVFGTEEDGQGYFDWVQELFIDPNNMYADASDLTKTLEPFQNPRTGSLRDSGLSDIEKRNLLNLGVEAFKKSEIPPLPPIPGAIQEIPVEPYQGMTIDDSTDMSDILSEKDWKEITREAQESTKYNENPHYSNWWKKYGPSGTVWYGPGEPYDLTE